MLIRITGLFILLLSLAFEGAKAQTFELTMQQQAIAGYLKVDLYIKRTSANPFELGPSNFVVNVDTSVIDLNNKTIETVGIWNGSLATDRYLPLSVGGTNTFFNVTVTKNPDPLAPPNGFVVPNTPTLIARISLKLKDDQCEGTSILRWRKTSGVILSWNLNYIKNGATFIEPSDLPFGTQVIGQSVACAKQDGLKFYADIVGDWQIISSVGTTFSNGQTTISNTDTVFVKTGAPQGFSASDTILLISPALCEFRKVLVVNPLPDANIIGPNLVTTPALNTIYQALPSSGVSYQWAFSSPGGLSQTVGSLTNQTISLDLKGSQADTLFLTATHLNTGCVGRDTLIIEKENCIAVAGQIANDTTICNATRTVVYLYSFQGDTIFWEQATSATGPWIPAVGGIGDSAQVFLTDFINSDTYFRAIVSSGVCKDTSEVTAVFAVSKSLTGFIDGSFDVCQDSSAHLTLTNSLGQPQWQQSNDGLTDWSDVTTGVGFATTDFTSTPITASIFYRVRITGGCDTLYTSPVKIKVTLPPLATFPGSIDPVCGDSLSLPLGATLTRGAGVWSTTSSTGFFVNPTDPNTRYLALGDGGKTVTLVYTVFSGNCEPLSLAQNVQVNAQPIGSFTQKPDTICSGGNSLPLNATAEIGTGIWTTTGAGTFIPNSLDPNAEYLSALADGGKNITLNWIVSNEGCTDITYSQQIFVRSTQIQGTFSTPPPNVCVTDISVPLGATVTQGVGVWTTNGTGNFIPNNTDPNAQYDPGEDDAGSFITLTWNITNGACPPLILSQDIRVNRVPVGDILSPVNPICEGDSIIIQASAQIGTGQWVVVHKNPGPPIGVFQVLTNNRLKYKSFNGQGGTEVDIYWIVSNGACKADTNKRTLIISDPPVGSFTTNVPVTCAGAPTIPLCATLVSGTGTWKTTNGQGTFSDPNDPCAFYNSVLTDANQTVVLIYEICSPGCGCIADTQTVFINNVFVLGEFSTILPDICAGDTTIPFGASFGAGSTAEWETTGGGIFIPNKNDPNARYVSVPADGDKTISITFVVKNGGCAALKLIQPLRVFAKPDGSFNTTLAPLCFEPGVRSQPLNATVIKGAGEWKCVSCSGSFTSFTSDTARYVPGFSDIGNDIELLWIVKNGVCGADTNKQIIHIDAPAAGNFNKTLAPLCAGSTTPPLGATTLSGTGFWWKSTGAGYFSDVNDPNATYTSDLADAGTTIELAWVVTSGSCKPDTNRQSIQILNTKVAGSFNTVIPPICDGETTIALGAVVTDGNGRWSVSSNATGFIVGGLTNPNAVYQAVGDGGKTIQITWSITNGGIVPCDTIRYTQELVVSPKPNGDLPTKPGDICAGAVSDTLTGVALIGQGRWSCQNCAGTFANPLANKTVYQSSVNDGGNTITLVWKVGVQGCDSVEYKTFIKVFKTSLGAFSTALPTICAGQSSISLNASTTNGVGFWSQTGGSGGFTNTNDPAARYISVAADGGKTIQICWNVQNGACSVVQYCQNLKIDALSEGQFNTVLPIVCEGQSTGPLGASVTTGTGQWQTTGKGTFIGGLTNGNASYQVGAGDADTTVILRWVVTNGQCSAVVYQQVLNVLENGKGGFPVSPGQVCANACTGPLGAFASVGSGVWSHNGTGYFSNPFSSASSYCTRESDRGNTITLTWKVGNGQCDSTSYSQQIQVIGSTTATIIFPTTDVVDVCRGDSVKLEAAGGTAYQWTSTQPVINEFSASALGAPLFSAYYYVTITDENGCRRRDSVFFNVKQPAVLTAGSDDADNSICGGGRLTLNVTGATGAILWSPASSLNNPTLANPIATPTTTTTYTVRALTSTGCVATSTVTIVVTPFASPVLDATDVCQKSIYTLTTANNEQCDFIFWFNTDLETAYQAGPMNETNPYWVYTGDSLEVNTENPAFYRYTITCYDSETTCESYAQDSFSVMKKPKANFTADRTEAPFSDRLINFTNTSTDETTYLWYFGDTLSGPLNTDTIPNPSHDFSQSGIYTVVLVVTNELGNACSDIKIANNYIKILDENFWFPTAFTPNGDGLNDRFRPLPADGSARIVKMDIFDQWNKVIFSTTDVNGWDGKTADGKPFDAGLYSYQVLIDQNPNGIKTYRGYITLIR